MKRALLTVMYSFALCTEIETLAQSTFQNLDFESATLVSAGPPFVQFAPAFPGWTCNIGTNPVDSALYNTVALDSSAISIIDHGWANSFGGVIAGNFTAVLQAGLFGPNNTIEDTTLSQTGVVPVTARSLRFSAYFLTLNSPQFALVVSLGGQNLSFTPLLSGANYTEYGADISSWAGQNADLSFTVVAENPHRNNEYLFLDSIQFSDLAVPEPSIVSLSALGALILSWRFVRTRRR